MTSAAIPMDEAMQPPARPATVRLRYNNVFLPEYLSTIVISIVISVPFLLMPIGGGVPLGRNVHAPIGLTLYGIIVVVLAHRTFTHRGRHRRIFVSHDPDVGVVAKVGRETVHLQRLDLCELRIDRFFGRRVRAIHLRDDRGHELVVHDALDGFPEFLRLVLRVAGRRPSIGHDYEELQQRVADAWTERHNVFPLTVEASVSRAVIRFFFLIPVAFVDFLGNLWMNFEFAAARRSELAVYSAPLMLLLAAFVNRYVSYYLLTSRRMNR